MKRIAATLLTISLTLSLTGCGSGPVYNPDRWQYDPDTRVVLSEGRGFDTMEPTVRNNAIVADVVIKGIVRDDGQVLTTDFAGNDQLPEGSRFSLSSTVFQVEVAEVWYGKLREKTIAVSFFGGPTNGITKPRKDDVLILFLNRTETENQYVPTCLEDSFFAVNPPDDTLYAFSSLPALTEFDHQEEDALKQAVADVYQQVKEGKIQWNGPWGAIAEPLRK